MMANKTATAYLTDTDGKFIPATQRPDGTWRKARRVKDGYVPQEEVPLYESKGKQFAQRKGGLPPGVCPHVAEASKKEREKRERAKSKKQEKSAAESKKQQTPGLIVLSTASAKPVGSQKPNTNAITSNTTNAAVDTLSTDLLATLKLQDDPEELAKKLKKLRKKLREIETIEEKIKSGDLKKPEKDQLDKVKRKKEILKDIKKLEEEEVGEQPLPNGGH